MPLSDDERARIEAELRAARQPGRAPDPDATPPHGQVLPPERSKFQEARTDWRYLIGALIAVPVVLVLIMAVGQRGTVTIEATRTAAQSATAPPAKPMHIRLAEFDGRRDDAESIRIAFQNLRRQCGKNTDEQIADAIYTGQKRHREQHRSKLTMLEVATALDSLTASWAGLGDPRNGDCVQAMGAWLYLEAK